jgi:hypothetical protein
METEAPAVIKTKRPAKSWPSQGKLIFENVKLRYRTESSSTSLSLGEREAQVSV